MIDLLHHVWDAIRSVPYLLADLVVGVVNGFIAAIGALIQWVVNLLPDFPASPGAPSSGILAWLNWIVPVGPLLALFAAFVTLWVTFLVVKIAANWAKAL